MSLFDVDPDWRVNAAKCRISRAAVEFNRTYKPYVCSACTREFVEKRDLWKHRLRGGCIPESTKKSVVQLELFKSEE